METGADDATVKRWEPVLEGIEDDYTKRVCAQLMENQAKHVISERLDEAETTVGHLGTFQKFAFPLVRRVFPELIANHIVGVQPMSGPVSQVFYLGSNRESGGTEQTLYSKYDLTYRGQTSTTIGDGTNTSGIDLDLTDSVDTSTLLDDSEASPSGTYGGQIADWPPNAPGMFGWSVSAGEGLTGTGIPEMTFHIEQQPVIARTRKMRALWTLEAQQDLRAYHNLDLERELTELLSKEIKLEIDRELIEDIRMLAYDVSGSWGGFDYGVLDQSNSNNMDMNPADDSTFGSFVYDFTATTNPAGALTSTNVWLHDFSSSSLPFAPQHVGHTYSNLLAIINFAAQDVYRTTHRGPANWIVTSPLIASMLESAAKLEGGIASGDGPTNISKSAISYKGKFMGRYDLYVDPLYPQDEILLGYKGDGPMDAGFIYSPYIPLQQLPKIVDPETFQPRKGLLTRYGKTAITPASRFYRIIRIVGPSTNFLFQPFQQNALNNPPNAGI